jgi:predicted Rossmann fold flavoprotein
MPLMSSERFSPQVTVLGGGAAGFFAALACARENPACRVIILERTAQTLSKVKISGGGRCNVTHACFNPPRLVTFYPRGGQALRGPFNRFQPQDTIDWFEARGVPLKTEEDGRMFPTSDKSQTIIDCLMEEARRASITIRTQTLVNSIERRDPEAGFILRLGSGGFLEADRLILATGGNPQGWEWAASLGHTIEPPVPSLFTFTVKDARLEGLSGVSVPQASVAIEGTTWAQTGALLVTHWGFSGPVTLKLSAWAARALHDLGYQARLCVNWLPELRAQEVLERLHELRTRQKLKKAPGDYSFGLPRRLWVRLAAVSGVLANKRWTEISNESLKKLAGELHEGIYLMSGKSVFKEEFVTCGGVRLEEVNFRTMESKRCPGLYFAGEVLDIDGVTGGFNFQSAWTTGYLAGQAAARSLTPT